MGRMGGVPGRQVALPWKRVVVEELAEEGSIALCVDQFGHHLNVSTMMMRAKGARPQPGETWVVSLDIGDRWSFAAVLSQDIPTVDGSRGDGTALESLLQALDQLGLIVDETEP